MATTFNYARTKTGNKYFINIFIDISGKLMFNDIVLAIEDTLSKIFISDYEEKVLDKTIGIEQYREILDNVLDQIECLDIFLNNDAFLRVINENKIKIDLTKEILDTIF